MIPSAAVDLLPPAVRRTAPFHRRDGMQTVEHVGALEGADGRVLVVEEGGALGLPGCVTGVGPTDRGAWESSNVICFYKQCIW
jgi:hypothetical protein